MKTTKKYDSELKLTRDLNHREAATVLAALRFWQDNARHGPGRLPEEYEHFEDGTKPLTLKQIDKLCEAINLQPIGEPEVGKRDLDQVNILARFLIRAEARVMGVEEELPANLQVGDLLDHVHELVHDMVDYERNQRPVKLAPVKEVQYPEEPRYSAEQWAEARSKAGERPIHCPYCGGINVVHAM